MIWIGILLYALAGLATATVTLHCHKQWSRMKPEDEYASLLTGLVWPIIPPLFLGMWTITKLEEMIFKQEEE
jgi:hypothetical protein